MTPLKLCTVDRDEHGTTYIIPEVLRTASPGGRVSDGMPSLVVWWARRFKDRSDETLMIRQQQSDDRVDLVEVTFAQLYALIEALNAAVEDI